jgi:hypothetical protein
VPHTFTGPERTAVQGTSLDQYAKLEVQDPDLNWVDVSTGLGSTDWFNTASVSDSVDANSLTFQASLLRNTETLSLAPLRTDSTLNRDATTTYAPMLDLVRMWRLSVSVVADAGTPSYKEIAKGYVDTIDVDDISPTITIAGRGEEAQLIDCEILAIRTYSVGSTSTMGEVIQALLDDNLASPPTLYEPVPISFVINEYEQNFGNLMQAITSVASLVGAVVRYRYDSAGVNRLTLFLPDRDAVPGDEDWEIGADEYLRIPVNRTDISGVRNYVPVRYNDVDTSTVVTVESPVGGVSQSISRYGVRSLPIDLAEDSQVLSGTDAQALADAIRADLEWPYLQQRIVTYGFWFVQLCDYGKTLANNVHYDSPQYGGVVGFSHEISNCVIKTSIDMGGPPIGGYRKWVVIARKRRVLRPPTDGPIGDPLFPPLTPPAEGSFITSAGRIGLVGLGTGSGATVGPSGTGEVTYACVSVLSGLAISSDYAMGLCDVSSMSDVRALSAQLTGSTNKNYAPVTAGKRMANIWGVSLVSDPTSANGSQHLLLSNPGLGVADNGITWSSDTYQNINIPFPGETYTNFWSRVVSRNMQSGTVSGSGVGFYMGTQAVYFNGFRVYRKSTDNKIYVKSDLQSSPRTGTPPR